MNLISKQQEIETLVLKPILFVMHQQPESGILGGKLLCISTSPVLPLFFVPDKSQHLACIKVGVD